MKQIVFLIFCMVLIPGISESVPLPIHYPAITAPVVHSGRYHILTCGKTCVVLDGTLGMTINMICYNDDSLTLHDSKNAAATETSLYARVLANGEPVELDQIYDHAARLEIIDQGPGRIAARVYFNLCSADGQPYGSGTTDIYIYQESVYLAHSLYIDDVNSNVVITDAGFAEFIPGNNAELIVKGSKLLHTEKPRYISFGNDEDTFDITVNNPGYASMRIGWIRNKNPEWLYMREIDTNPETDELYEKWPLWITQRGNPLTWKRTDNSGLLAGYEKSSLNILDFKWANGDSLVVPVGGYTSLNGICAIFLGSDSAAAAEQWESHKRPKKSLTVDKGIYRYYNEIEGVYEIDTDGGDVDVTFENGDNNAQFPVYVRLWNLTGKGGYEILVDNKPVPFGLYNDGDILEDPMVPLVKETSGPARFAGVAFHVGKNKAVRLTMTHKPGMQFTYQMYSDLETYELWSDSCAEKPVLRFHQKRNAIYDITLPGNNKFACAKLPVYWLKNGINQNTFMNNLRGFTVSENSPERLHFLVKGINLQGTGLSEFSVTVPYEKNRITLNVNARFTSLGDNQIWTSLEYCDLYPFDSVYRRDFHYDDVTFLNQNGEFDRVGTGAWSGRFETVTEPERDSYYATTTTREGPGSRIPGSADGTVWILGSNPERGNVLFRRGDWMPSGETKSVFGLCNAWVDIHNTIVNRTSTSASESITYTIEVFGGQVPALETLNELYVKAAGEKKVKKVTKVEYTDDGVIRSFVVE